MGIKIVFFLIGLLATGLGAFLWWRSMKLKKECTAQVSGVVSSVDHTTSVKRSMKGIRIQNRYRETFKYSVNGVEYIKQSNNTTRRPKLHEGQSITVFHDPAKPERYYVLEEGTQIMASVFFIAFGVVFMLAAPFLTMAK